ncbi:serine O-acetyltransferase [Pseudomonas sp. UBA4194]|uniref:serine O-acetyltransferase n=1 Tax=Pseudomonas sp. UBA4194 TaxID=1947317 RepID=UPI0025D9E2CF|nr:serine O-acetyltransferase [Pseudomonas sp. UBA4194]
MQCLLDVAQLRDQLHQHLRQTLSLAELAMLERHVDPVIDQASERLTGDLFAYAARDPASKGRVDVILTCYAAFNAVLFYRLAHLLLGLEALPGPKRMAMAQKLSNRGKLLSGAEIHPAAIIGQRFVLDHGYGTVIGETCRLGDDCYILGGVTLGARGIANNPGGKRHPTLGNNVEIGAGVKVLGPIRVGDNVFIGPSCVVTQDIPDDACVNIVNQLQIHKGSPHSQRRIISAFAIDERLHLVGEVSVGNNLTVTDGDHHPLEELILEPVVIERNHIQYAIRQGANAGRALTFPMNLSVTGPETLAVLLAPPGLSDLVIQTLQAHTSAWEVKVCQ